VRPEDADPLTVIEDQEPPPHHRHRFDVRYRAMTLIAFRSPHWLWMRLPTATRSWWAGEWLRRYLAETGRDALLGFALLVVIGLRVAG
jgi:hypothetical protein